MDSEDLTTEQCRRMHDSLFRLANYLCRLKQRMERTGFPMDDPLYRKTKSAYDEVCGLMVEAHYMSCKSGVGKPQRE